MFSRKIVVPRPQSLEGAVGADKGSPREGMEASPTLIPRCESQDGLTATRDSGLADMMADPEFVALLDVDVDLDCEMNSSFDSIDILESPVSHSDGQIFSHSQGTNTSELEETRQPTVAKKKHYRKRAAPKPPIPANNQGSTDSENWVVVNTSESESLNLLSVPGALGLGSATKSVKDTGGQSPVSGSPTQSPRSRPKSLHLKLPNFMQSPKNKHIRKNSKHEKKKEEKRNRKHGTQEFLDTKDCLFVCLPDELNEVGTEFEVSYLIRTDLNCIHSDLQVCF